MPESRICLPKQLAGELERLILHLLHEMVMLAKRLCGVLFFTLYLQSDLRSISPPIFSSVTSEGLALNAGVVPLRNRRKPRPF